MRVEKSNIKHQAKFEVPKTSSWLGRKVEWLINSILAVFHRGISPSKPVAVRRPRRRYTSPVAARAQALRQSRVALKNKTHGQFLEIIHFLERCIGSEPRNLASANAAFRKKVFALPQEEQGHFQLFHGTRDRDLPMKEQYQELKAYFEQRAKRNTQ